MGESASALEDWCLPRGSRGTYTSSPFGRGDTPGSLVAGGYSHVAAHHINLISGVFRACVRAVLADQLRVQGNSCHTHGALMSELQ